MCIYIGIYMTVCIHVLILYSKYDFSPNSQTTDCLLKALHDHFSLLIEWGGSVCLGDLINATLALSTSEDVEGDMKWIH